MITCNSCKTENQDSSKFCINCGEALVVETGRRGPKPARRRRTTEVGGYSDGKNPTVSALLSFFPGVGQFYNGDTKKGGIFLACWLILVPISGGILYLPLAAYAAYDAYQVADGKKQLGEW